MILGLEHASTKVEGASVKACGGQDTTSLFWDAFGACSVLEHHLAPTTRSSCSHLRHKQRHFLAEVLWRRSQKRATVLGRHATPPLLRWASWNHWARLSHKNDPSWFALWWCSNNCCCPKVVAVSSYLQPEAHHVWIYITRLMDVAYISNAFLIHFLYMFLHVIYLSYTRCIHFLYIAYTYCIHVLYISYTCPIHVLYMSYTFLIPLLYLLYDVYKTFVIYAIESY